MLLVSIAYFMVKVFKLESRPRWSARWSAKFHIRFPG